MQPSDRLELPVLVRAERIKSTGESQMNFWSAELIVNSEDDRKKGKKDQNAGGQESQSETMKFEVLPRTSIS